MSRWPKRTVEERFFEKVDMSAGPGDCHVWTASKTTAGYGTFGLRAGTIVYAHRWAMERALGRRLATKEFVLHSCDNPPCVNPAHLSIGDQKQNMRECVERGRANLGGLELGRSRSTLGQYRTGPEQCGTVNGYNRHRRHGELTCPACRLAAAAYNKQRRAARR